MRIREATPMEKEGRLGVPSTSTPMLLSKFYQEGGPAQVQEGGGGGVPEVGRMRGSQS